MTYYNRDRQELLLKKEDMEFLDNGSFGRCFHNGEVVLKEYFPWVGPSIRISAKMFDIFKSINNPHFIELLDIYSDSNLLSHIMCKLGVKKFITDVYTAKYYPDNCVNALYGNIDYILDNFREIEKLFDEFADDNISVNDIKRKNCILGSNDIVIIDPDLFAKTERHQDDYIATANKQNLLNFFHSISFNAMQSLFSVNEKLFVNQKINSIIEDITVKKNTDIAYQLSKKIGHVKRPIDYLRE